MIKWIIWAVLKIGTYFLVDFPSTIWKHFLLFWLLRVVFKSSENQLIRKLSSVRIVKNLVKYLLSGTFDFLLTQPMPNFLLDFLELLALKKSCPLFVMPPFVLIICAMIFVMLPICIFGRSCQVRKQLWTSLNTVFQGHWKSRHTVLFSTIES